MAEQNPYRTPLDEIGLSRRRGPSRPFLKRAAAIALVLVGFSGFWYADRLIGPIVQLTGGGFGVRPANNGGFSTLSAAGPVRWMLIVWYVAAVPVITGIIIWLRTLGGDKS